MAEQNKTDGDSEAVHRIAIAHRTRAERLDLSGLGLTELTQVAWLGQLAGHLQALDLSSNELTALPISLGQLPHLQELHLSSNRLSRCRSRSASSKSCRGCTFPVTN